MRLKVFYNKNQSVSGNNSFSPSAGKPALAVESWKKFPIEIVDFKPLTAKQIALAHDPAYVKGILTGTMNNGFSNKSRAVAKSLRWTTGSFAAAALHAFKTGECAASPTSGFHHAGWAYSGGFCTFEGLAIATRLLLQAGAKKVGIIDLDMHGPQTMHIIERLGLTDQVRHYAFGDYALASRGSANEWLKALPGIVRGFKDCDVILYQAGADPAIGDPLGGALSAQQLRIRDKIVFRMAKAIGVPVAWNLAGGYQEPFSKVLAIHDATVEECLKVHRRKK